MIYNEKKEGRVFEENQNFFNAKIER